MSWWDSADSGESGVVRPILTRRIGFRDAWVPFGLLSFSLFIGCPALAGELKVRHEPRQPQAGVAVVVTAQGGPLETTEKAVLEYQVVEPGRYISRADPTYKSSWTPMPMSRKSAGATNSWSAQLPPALQKNRQLIRYRIVEAAKHKLLAPSPDESVTNYAYFVYDGIPAWRAAVHPKGTSAEREAHVFDTNVMRSVQAYHLIASKRAVENVMWYEPTDFGDDEARHQYRYTCTIVADNKVYDHVRFRARGGVWRHAMGKNMWKFDFPKGHRLEARDDFGQKYPEKWEKLNLSACIQQGDYGYRGEQGMFEATTFKMFNLAGVPAPMTHWIQLRVVSEAEESPADQYRGDFWGLYLAIENIDEHFLGGHSLPDESLFKVDGGRPHYSYQATNGATEAQALQLLMGRTTAARRAGGIEALVDLPSYYNYRSILECTHHYDVDAGKNYFFYRHPGSKLWSVIPWDVDLTWADSMFGGGYEPFFAGGLLRSPENKRSYQNRLREVRDLLFNPEQAGLLIDELGMVISGVGNKFSLAEADRRKWDHHPIVQSRYVMAMKAVPGAFYVKSPTGDFPGMTRLMKDYVKRRSAWVDRTLLGSQAIPKPPQLKMPPGAKPTIQSLKSNQPLAISLEEGADAKSVRWHLGDVTRGSKDAGGQRWSGAFEIVPVWRTNGVDRIEIPREVLKAGRIYRLRARVTDPEGNASHYSKPFEFSTVE